VRRLLVAGELVRVQGDRLRWRGAEGEITGHIKFRPGGSAFVIPDDVREATMTRRSRSPPRMPMSPSMATGYPCAFFEHRKARRDGRGTEATGRVTRVLERAKDSIVGTLQRSGRSYFVLPDDPRLQQTVVVRDPAGTPGPSGGRARRQGRGETQSLDQPPRSAHGRAHPTARADLRARAELLGVYEKFDLDPKFPTEVEREAAALPDRVRPAELANRLDYREVPTFTIDPTMQRISTTRSHLRRSITARCGSACTSPMCRPM